MGRRFITAGLIFVTGASLHGAPFNPDNLLVAINVSSNNPLPPFTYESWAVEYTPTGHAVQMIPFNLNDGSDSQRPFIIDLVVDSGGVVDASTVFGISSPTDDVEYFSRYFPNTGTLVNRHFPGGFISGFIATYQNFIFINQGQTGRFDLTNYSQVLLAGHPNVMGLATGLDGRLYVTYRVQLSLNTFQAKGIDVFDPLTGAWLYTVDLPAPLRRNAAINHLAVDASGRIFIADDRWTVFRLNRHGEVEASKMLVHPPDFLSDVALDENGRLVVTSYNGFIFVGDTTLTNFTSFHFPRDSDHTVNATAGTFAKYLPPAATAPLVTSTSSRLANISGRSKVQTGERVGIAGFIVTGTGAKKVVARGIGPSLSSSFGAGALQDPILELRDSSGALIASNDNWMTDPAHDEISAEGLAPQTNEESALSRSLPAGRYTAILRGKNDTTGIGLIELYDVDTSTMAKLANISTRGYVDRGDNVVIGGFIINGHAIDGDGGKVVVRGIGPSLAQSGVSDALADPTLELYNTFGWRLASNDNWRDTDPAGIQGVRLAPPNQRESAILATLSSGAYTAILRGKNNTTGTGLVEVYSIQ